MTRDCGRARVARRRRVGTLVVMVLSGGFVLTAYACSGERAQASIDETHVVVKADEIGDTSLVTVPHPERFALVSVSKVEIADRLAVTGSVSPDVNRTVPVNALGGGRVLAVKAKLGDDVRKGQTLLVISSPDAGSAVADYQKFRADEALARRQLERSQQLFAHGVVARKDLEIAEATYQKAKVDFSTATERLRMLGGDPSHPTPYIELKAPISGTIVEQNVTASSGVKSPDNAPNLFTIADLSRVWVLCDVYENDLPSVRTGQLAEVRLNAIPEKVFHGVVGPISKVLDPNTRTAKVRIELDNRAGIMRQGMFATVTLVASVRREQMVLPASALLRLHDADWVFVKGDNNRFRRVRVRTGPMTADSVQEIVSGVSTGEKVVRNALEFGRSIEQD
ncbi:MAG: efflux RND transporter periplasmic adaptor subunit [Gemmatimonadaceae bacterium]